MAKRNVLAAASILLMCSVAGCGNTTPAPPGTGVPGAVTTPASHTDVLCESLRQLGSDVHALLTIDVVLVGANGLDAAVHEVYEQLRVVAQNADSTYASHLRALHTELDDLSDTIVSLTNTDSIRAALPPLASGLTAVGRGWEAVERQASDVCS